MTQRRLTCTSWMSPWPLVIWLTCSTRTTCSHQIPRVTGVSDSAPNSSSGVASISIWQGAWGTTGPWQLVKKHGIVWLDVDTVRLPMLTSVKSIHTHLVNIHVVNNMVEKDRRSQDGCELKQEPTCLKASTVLWLMPTSLVNSFIYWRMWLGKAKVPVWVISIFKPFQMSHLTLLIMALRFKSSIDSYGHVNTCKKCIKLIVQ